METLIISSIVVILVIIILQIIKRKSKKVIKYDENFSGGYVEPVEDTQKKEDEI